MKKRLLGALLCVIMVMALLPATAFAESDDDVTNEANATSVWIAGVELTSAAPYYHNGAEGAPGTVNSTKTGYNAYFDANAGTLTLNGLNVKDSTVTKEVTLGGTPGTPGTLATVTYAVYAKDNLTICVDGDNSVSVGNVETNVNAFSLALYVTGGLTVQPGDTGSGSLTAESKGARITESNNCIAHCGGVTAKTLEVSDDATLIGQVSGDVFATSAAYAFGVNVNAVTVDGGTLKGIASGDVICGESGSSITCGIIVNEGNLSLSAGSVEATGGQSLSEASTSFGVAMTNEYDSISITGGSFTAKSGTAKTTAAVQYPLLLGFGITAKGSTFSDGSSPDDYESAKNATYKWVSVAPTVTSVAVNPATVSIQKGGTQTFNATVYGKNNPAQTVTWTVEEGVKETNINDKGLLTVSASETAATLTVKATSTVNNKISGTATVTVITRYQVIKGADGKWTKGSASGLSFTSDGSFERFTGVSVDGDAISEDNYDSREGSTVVTLKTSYLETLSVGQHTLRMNFTNGYAETNFNIQASANPDNPTTGDNSQPWLWLGIMLIAGAGLLASFALRHKGQN